MKPKQTSTSIQSNRIKQNLKPLSKFGQNLKPIKTTLNLHNPRLICVPLALIIHKQSMSKSQTNKNQQNQLNIQNRPY